MLVKELEDREAVKGVEHDIELEPGTKPICIPLRRFSPKEMEALTKQVKELKEKKVSRPSNSPWCARALLVPKKDGSTRMTIDYTALNKHTVKDRFPLPNINTIFQHLGGAKYFSTFDLASGYFSSRCVRVMLKRQRLRPLKVCMNSCVCPWGCPMLQLHSSEP